MSWQAFIGVFLFGFVTIATPGPANLALMAAGAGAGVKRGVPFLAGIWGGGFAVLVAMGAGLGVLLASVPDLYRALQVAGICYIIILPCASCGQVRLGRMKPLSRPLSGRGFSFIRSTRKFMP